MSIRCFPLFQRQRCPARALGWGLVLALGLGPAGAQAKDTRTDQAPQSHPSQGSKVLGGMQRGTDAAGRGIDKAEKATRRGVNRVSESASRPVRNVGESFGRKLEQGPGGGRARAPATTGPKAEGP